MIDPKSIGVVDVSEWDADEDNPIFPVGSQPQEALSLAGEFQFSWIDFGTSLSFKKAEGWAHN